MTHTFQVPTQNKRHKRHKRHTVIGYASCVMHVSCYKILKKNNYLERMTLMTLMTFKSAPKSKGTLSVMLSVMTSVIKAQIQPNLNNPKTAATRCDQTRCLRRKTRTMTEYTIKNGKLMTAAEAKGIKTKATPERQAALDAQGNTNADGSFVSVASAKAKAAKGAKK